MSDVLRSEWTKLYSVGATRWTPMVALLSVPVLAVVVGLTNSLTPDDTVLGGSLTGAVLGQLGVAVLGVLMMSTEYSTGMARATFAATPGRPRVLAAKATLVSAVSFAVGLIGCGSGYLIGRGLLAGHQPGQPWPAVLGLAMAFAFAALLGLAMVVLVRHTAGALALAAGIVVLPAMLAPLLGEWGRPIVSVAPATVLAKLAQSSDAAVSGGPGPWASLAVVGGYSLAALAVSTLVLQRRDV